MNYKIFHFKSLPSTQDTARELSKKGLSNIVVVADAQTKARGRFHRKWHSAKGGLWMSILLKPKNPEMQYLTFIASIAVAKTIKSVAELSAKIKWPNDVHYKGKKLCGILTEGIFPANFLIVGIGINVNQSKFPKQIKDTATSLKIIKNKSYETERLLEKMLDNFSSLYKLYDKGKFHEILGIWKRYCDTIGKNVIVSAQSGKIAGKAVGIAKDCSLLLRTKQNKIIRIVEGDIRVMH